MNDIEKNNFIEQLYRKYYSSIASYCTTMLNGDAQDGELCAHEVFEQAIIDVEKLACHPNIVGWLKITAHNRVKRAVRKKTSQSKFELHITDVSERYIDALSYVEAYDEQFETEFDDINKEKERILETLSVNERELYELRFVKKKKYNEIAKIIGLSESATRMRTVRLELQIKQAVAKLFSDT